MNKLLLLGSLELILHSCWFPCAPGGYGNIIDAQTSLPIDSAEVLVYENGSLVREIYTDSLGFFDFRAVSKSSFIGTSCEAHVEVIVSKEGYETKEESYQLPYWDAIIELDSL